ncbi:GTPase ObgE [bacterium]|nr:GTPase ObgE [bacterium]MBU0899397.1 GTPase ObgE [bacterium]MBU1153332.1 GTPase ObgE [bacterium]MBU1782210.1 GTPase ObgE [bacterium]MBU2598977.1 GTPase ObgE [bacterium]
MFVDQIKIKVCAGKGGNGCVSFHHEKYKPLGGPDGGNGGKGGDVTIKGNFNLKTLRDIQDKRYYQAGKGEQGYGNNSSGHNGKNLLIEVPLGTQIYDLLTQELIEDITEDQEEVVVAYGGKGGKGNAKYATSSRQTPKFAQKGEPGEAKDLKLVLKLIAEVGILGYPNVGKSTLLSKLTKAKPKIGEYPFTTLTPNLGVVNPEEEISFTVADLPGIIEGASEGVGLGDQFLRHIERTKILVHLVDVTDLEVVKKYHILNQELKTYNQELIKKPQLLVGNKIDLLNQEEIKEVKKIFSNLKKEIIFISALNQKNIKILIKKIGQTLNKIPTLPKETIPRLRVKEYKLKPAFQIHKEDRCFIIESEKLQRIIKEVNFEDLSVISYWHHLVEKMGIDKVLREMGAMEGDLVKIGDLEFEYYP